MSILSKQERKIINTLGEAWDLFMELDEIHSSDRPEFMAFIHSAQNIVLARPALVELQSELAADTQRGDG